MTDIFNLQDKVALVTGGARGIGTSIVKAFLSQGAKVAFTFLHPSDNAKALINHAPGRVMGIQADCANRVQANGAVEKIVQNWGGIHILVLNAGIARDRVSWKLNEEDFDKVIDTNLKGAFVTAKSVIPLFREQQYGKIVSIASINGIRGKAGQSAYSASKGGLIAFTKTLARELGPKNINANVVAPGLIETDMTKDLPEEILTAALNETAVKRLGTTADVAGAVLFFASDLTRHVTGQVLNVDGGQLI
ncbi:MAG: SDR family oxidoreductase [Deltaproteobacteria bacterium]|nr:SDR family oxidoreductase [Deltaproteobacteria bacterium]MBN2674771.1 SDR family oxidoreductase [Deltaproteobacteria bacterium]